MRKFNLKNGIDGLFIENSRFNTTVVSFNFYTSLSEQTASVNSLLAYILSSCCAEYKTTKEINIALGMLYGATVSLNVSKISNLQHIKLSVSAINDEYTPNNESNIESAVNLLLKLIFEPNVSASQFSLADLQREKRKVCEVISAELNDKRTYSRKRCVKEMFAGLPNAISALGEPEIINSLSCADIFKAWQRLLSEAYLRIIVVGKNMPYNILNLVEHRFKDIKRDCRVNLKENSFLSESSEVKVVKESMNVSQGKLVMGFSSLLNGYDAFALSVAADIFGGGPYSKLFENVREKMSLCYYCAAQAVKLSGYVLVDSGVEVQKCETAESEILNQLSALQNGDISDFTFDASIKNITGSLKSYNDSLAALDAWYSLCPDIELIKTPEQAAEIIGNITKQQVVQAARGIKLHTVYKLMPLGGDSDEN